MSFCFKIDNNAGSLFKYIYSHSDHNDFNSINVFLIEDGHGTDPNQIRTVVRDNNDSLDNNILQFDASSVIGDTSWHTYTLAVANGEGISVYLDGVLQKTDPSRGGDPINPTTDLHIGTRQDLDAARFYGGALDSVQVFNRALSPRDVEALHNRSVSRGTVSVTVGP